MRECVVENEFVKAICAAGGAAYKLTAKTKKGLPDSTFTNEDVKNEGTVRWSKMTDGIGLVFAGVISMLEALDGGTMEDILTTCKVEDGDKSGKEESDTSEETGAGNVDDERLFNDINRCAKIGLGFVFDAKIFE